MKMTKILVKTLCILCLAFGYVAESAEGARVVLEFANLANDLPTDWRPEAGKSLSFRVKVTKPPSYSGGSLIATLSDVTNYTGECGNRLSPYNDLELRLRSNPAWRAGSPGVSLTHPIRPNPNAEKESVEWISVTVDCADYAAYGKLTFSTGKGSIKEAFPIDVIIPRDKNKNKIADCWRNDETSADPKNTNPSKNYVASSDLDRGPNANLGDNMTVLDEYRGLIVNGSWTDTDPEGWDVFMRLADGLSSAGSLPQGISVYSMGLSEVNHERGHVMPYQASSFGLGTGAVYAIRLRNNYKAYDTNDPDNKVYGEIGMGPPSSGTHGDIFIRLIMRGLGAGQTKSGMITSVVTHEIGHGVSLGHCPNTTDLDCYMWEIAGSSAHHVTQYHSHHDIDYDLKSPRSGPQTPATIPDGKKRKYDPQTGTWSLGSDSSGNALLTPSGGVYTASAGDSHTAEVTVPSGYTLIYWYLKSPGESGYGTSVSTTTGDSSTTSASYTYSFPSYASGDYVLTAYITLSDNTIVEASYTVTVSSSTTSDSSTTADSSTSDSTTSDSSTADSSTSDSSTSDSSTTADSTTSDSSTTADSTTSDSSTSSDSSPAPAPTATCANGHTYDPSNSTENNRHRTRTCRWCGQTWQKCTSSAPICNKPYRKRNGLKCWAIE